MGRKKKLTRYTFPTVKDGVCEGCWLTSFSAGIIRRLPRQIGAPLLCGVCLDAALEGQDATMSHLKDELTRRGVAVPAGFEGQLRNVIREARAIK